MKPGIGRWELLRKEADHFESNVRKYMVEEAVWTADVC